ncbi:hypothetical protein [Desulfonatronovibrio magnus]|uniref:hypothetical protein n=1 Tax=Desulfonatronovibrio magnus TaxID=698827 RepID=UPI0005EB1BD1|nr:hypothetical protein [Desulfonatronovibrio magnus]
MEIGSTQGQAGMAMLATTLQNATMGADVVSKTLNAVNQVGNGAMNSNNADHDFQTKVLMAGAMGKGEILDVDV